MKATELTYPTKANFKEYAGITGAGDDDTIDQMLAHAQAAVEKHTGRVFVSASTTEDFFVNLPTITKNSLQLNLFRDLVSVTTVTNGNSEVISANDYDLYPKVPYYQIRLRRGKGVIWQSDGEDTPIQIAGSWGYSAACPDDIFLEIMRLTRLSFTARSSGEGVIVTRSGNLIDKSQWPPSTIQILDEYIRT